MDLHKEIKDIETESFKDFCKKLKIKNIAEYEAKSNTGQFENSGENIFDKKRDLEKII